MKFSIKSYVLPAFVLTLAGCVSQPREQKVDLGMRDFVRGVPGLQVIDTRADKSVYKTMFSGKQQIGVIKWVSGPPLEVALARHLSRSDSEAFNGKQVTVRIKDIDVKTDVRLSVFDQACQIESYVVINGVEPAQMISTYASNDKRAFLDSTAGQIILSHCLDAHALEILKFVDTGRVPTRR